MNNTLLASCVAISLNSFLLSYGAELSTEMSRYPFDTVKTLYVRAAVRANITIIEKNEIDGVRYIFKKHDDPEMEHAANGQARFKVKSDATFYVPARWYINIDVENAKGDVTYMFDKDTEKVFDISVKKWECMNNKTTTGLKWSYTWFLWAHYINEFQVTDKDAPIIKIWAKDGSLNMCNEQFIEKCKEKLAKERKDNEK